jgi:NitT/TauT family transport system permease protein
MSRLQRILAIAALLFAVLALVLPIGDFGGVPAVAWSSMPTLVFLVATLLAIGAFRLRAPTPATGILAAVGCVLLIVWVEPMDGARTGFWALLVLTWLLCWLFAEQLSADIRRGKADDRLFGWLVPVAFGIAVLITWEAITRGANVPQVLLPPPSMIWARLTASVPTLAADFIQTFKAVLAGFALGCGSGFIVAILVDRSPFLKRGLLPIGNFVSALPIIGIAPIMVMWFGFDWPSKAAVVVAMTFFPMLVNTVAGLNASSLIERDLMRTYAANYWETLFKLRLPAAAPFIFNALKINSTLALIGAIVAEFFGTPIVGMGFRISTEVGKLNIDLVWAEIAVAAVAGSAFYGVIALIERAVTFWHPSIRGGRT